MMRTIVIWISAVLMAGGLWSTSAVSQGLADEPAAPRSASEVTGGTAGKETGGSEAVSPVVEGEPVPPPEAGEVQERTVSLTQAVHFMDAKGQDVVVGPGSYEVEAEGTNRIRLLPAGTGEAVLIDAVSFTHQQTVDSPVPVTVPDPQQPDVLHLALLLPGGQGVGAIGTYSGVKPRGVTNTAILMQIAPAQTRQSVVIYEHPNFGGRSQTLGVGGHIFSDLNDIASSIRVSPGLVALLYEHADAGGGYGLSVDVLEDRPDLAQVNFNDKLSYVCVFSSPTPQGYIWARNTVQNGQFVAGHWERQRVGGTPVNITAVVAPPLPPHPANAPPASCSGGPIVRDQRTYPPFDLLPFHNAADDNGLLLNPQWGGQIANPNSLPNPMACHIDYPAYTTLATRFSPSVTFPAHSDAAPYIAPCTTQRTTFDTASICTAFGYGGHHNWAAATYEGAIYWKDHSAWYADGDYNLSLLTPAAGFGTNGKPLGVGLTSSNNVGVYGTTGVPWLKLEFDPDETIDQFHTPWWESFHTAVDDAERADDAVHTQLISDLFNPALLSRLREEAAQKWDIVHRMIAGKHAIVTGLFGVDCAHDCRSELHPVWAIAIRVKEDPSDEVWAIFVRRWGNEGFCSDDQHYLVNLPNDSYTFRLPWSPGASSGQVIQETLHTRYGQATGPYVTFSPNQGVLVSFTLPVPQSGEGERINGELHLRWAGAAAVGPPVVGTRPIVGTRAVPAPVEREDDPESRLGELVRKMTPAQRSVLNAKIPPKTISKDGAALRAAAAPRQVPSLQPRVLRSGATEVRSVPSAEKKAKNQQRLDALHAVYGPNIPGFPPSQGPNHPSVPSR